MLICTPLRANTLSNFLQKIEAASAKADMVELWLDGITHELNWEQVFKVKKIPYLLNLKAEKENGSFIGTDEEKLEILLEGVKYGAEYVDLDHKFPDSLIKKFIQEKSSAELILSAHFFENTPNFDALLNIAHRMKNLGADIIKIATMANTEEDVAVILKLSEKLKQDDIRHITIAMGKLGKKSRTQTHSEIVFVALNENEKTAPGQITAEEMRNYKL